MITYNPAFDLYHSIFRMAHIVNRLEDGEWFEIDKVRIWDYYLLFPSKLYDLSIKQTEKEVREARKRWIEKNRNPYEYSGNNRKLFEWIKPVQVSALSCLVSCGILSKDDYLNDKVCVSNREALRMFVEQAGDLTATERNTLSFLGLFSRSMPLSGANGLKARTDLLESKYDAE
jgi:hypothetical protein